MNKEEEKGKPLLSFDYVDDSDVSHKNCFVRWFLWLWQWLKPHKNTK